MSLRGLEGDEKVHPAAKSAIISHHSRFPIWFKSDIYYTVVLHNKIKKTATGKLIWSIATHKIKFNKTRRHTMDAALGNIIETRDR